MMHVWNGVKCRMSSQRAKIAKKKAMAGAELVAAGAALTGGSILMEELFNSKTPQVEDHNNVYATDSGATLFKVESLAGQEDTITNMEVLGWIIFGLILILLSIPMVRAILKIMRTCK